MNNLTKTWASKWYVINDKKPHRHLNFSHKMPMLVKITFTRYLDNIIPENLLKPTKVSDNACSHYSGSRSMNNRPTN